MLPLLVLAVGGYLVYDSVKKPKYADGGMMAKGGATDDKIAKVVRAIRKKRIHPDDVSPNFVNEIANEIGVNLSSKEVMDISDNYGEKYADGGMMAKGGVTYGDIVTDLRILNQIAKKYHLEFDKKFKYHVGSPYENKKGEKTPNYFSLGDRVFKLKYFDGSFSPFLIELDGNRFVYDKKTNEPEFVNYPNPQWDKDKYYTK
jgi:hypothetical protein